MPRKNRTVNREQIGKVMKMMRESKQMSQSQVSKDLGISIKHYNEMENGKSGDMDMLFKALSYYGCSISIKTPAISMNINLENS